MLLVANKVGSQWDAFRRGRLQLLSLVAAFSLIANIVQYNRYSLARPIVTVGRHIISKREYQASLEAIAGRTLLRKIVFEELVRQAAVKAGVMPSPRDIDTWLAGQRQHAPGSLAGQDNLVLRAEIGEALALENLRVQNVTASDSEIASYYANHVNDYRLPTKTQTSLVVASTASAAHEAVRLLTKNTPEAIIASRSGLQVAGVNGFHIAIGNLPTAVRVPMTALVTKLKSGDIKTFSLGKAYWIFKVKGHLGGRLLPLSLVRALVSRQVKLQKALSEEQEIAILYKASKPYFDMPTYQRYFSDVEDFPSSSSQPGALAQLSSAPHVAGQPQ